MPKLLEEAFFGMEPDLVQLKYMVPSKTSRKQLTGYSSIPATSYLYLLKFPCILYGLVVSHEIFQGREIMLTGLCG